MCTKCANWLHSEDNNHCDDNVQIYTSKRNFGGLHFPSSCFFTLIRICEETFNRHTKLLLSNQLTETTYIIIVLSMSSHIIIPACCKLAHLIIKKNSNHMLNITSKSHYGKFTAQIGKGFRGLLLNFIVNYNIFQ
jgi:hypothetical protein